MTLLHNWVKVNKFNQLYRGLGMSADVIQDWTRTAATHGLRKMRAKSEREDNIFVTTEACPAWFTHKSYNFQRQPGINDSCKKNT